MSSTRYALHVINLNRVFHLTGTCIILQVHVPVHVKNLNLSTKWRQNVKILVDLERTNQGLSYEVLHGMVPSISKFDPGVSKFRSAARPMKVKTDQPQKLITWVAGHLLLSYQVWSWSDKSYSKNKGFVDTLLSLSHDLDLWPWNGAINELVVNEGQLYMRCYMDVRLVVWGNSLNSNDYIQKKKKTKQTNKHTE
jgi:hypothetical protein